MATDAADVCAARSSAAMVISMFGKEALVFFAEDWIYSWNPNVEKLWNMYMYFCFLIYIKHNKY